MPAKVRKNGVLSQASDNECIEDSDTSDNIVLRLLLEITKFHDKFNSLKDETNNNKLEIIKLQHESEKLKSENATLLQRIETLELASGGWSTAPKAKRGPATDANDVTKIVADVTGELSARSSKSKNVVIMGLQECQDGGNQRESDGHGVKDLLEHSLGLDITTEIAEHFRLGVKKGDRPRPLKLKMSSQQSKDRIMGAARKLASLPVGHKYKRIFIGHDLTEIEREAEFKRRQEKRNKSHHLPVDDAE